MATLRLVPAAGPPIEITREASLVGREPTCDVVVADGSISRRHARIERRGATWMVVDQGSANGTFVDSKKVAEEPLRHGQEVRFGAISYKVEIPGEEDLGATVANVPVMEDEVTAMQPNPLAARPAERAAAPPPIPKPPVSAPPPVSPPPPRPSAPPPPPPPSAAAARERFKPPASASAPAAASGSPVPQMSDGAPAAAPARKGRGPVFWAGTGCCGCLVLVLLITGLLGGGLYFMTKDAANAAHTFVQHVKAGEIDQAYDGLSTSYKAEMPLQDFEQLVASHPGLKDNTGATFMSRSVVNDSATIGGILRSSTRTEAVAFQLVREGGAWKITAIRFPGE